MAITSLTIPSVVKSTCNVFCGESGIEGIRINIYRWVGTDRISILWEKQTTTSYKTIGKCDMYFTEWYSSIDELIKDREYLTKVMQEQGWGVLDLRDMDAVREFTEDFY